MAAGEYIDGDAKFHTFIHHLSRQRVGKQNTAGLAICTVAARVHHIGPIFEKYEPLVITGNNLEAAFESHKETPRKIFVSRAGCERLRAMLRARHYFRPRQWSMPCAAGSFFAHHFERSIGIKSRAQNGQRLPDSIQFGAPGTSHGNDYLRYGLVNDGWSPEAKMILFPKLGLFLTPETAAQETFQFVDGRKDLIGTGKHPPADLRERKLRDHIHRDAFAIG